jgi:hypothetical protein
MRPNRLRVIRPNPSAPTSSPSTKGSLSSSKDRLPDAFGLTSRRCWVALAFAKLGAEFFEHINHRRSRHFPLLEILDHINKEREI